MTRPDWLLNPGRTDQPELKRFQAASLCAAGRLLAPIVEEEKNGS
jgi:hypothetical protein